MMREPVLLWCYYDAPEWAKELFHPDDTDWIAVVPPGMELPSCIDENRFGCCEIMERVLETGHTVYCGRHA